MRESKIKIFTYNECDKMEREVNKWLLESVVEVLSLQYQFTCDGGYNRHSVLIFYRDY